MVRSLADRTFQLSPRLRPSHFLSSHQMCNTSLARSCPSPRLQCPGKPIPLASVRQTPQRKKETLDASMFSRRFAFATEQVKKKPAQKTEEADSTRRRKINSAGPLGFVVRAILIPLGRKCETLSRKRSTDACWSNSKRFIIASNAMTTSAASLL